MRCLDLDLTVLKDGLAGFDECRQGNLYIILVARPLSPGRCPGRCSGPVVAVSSTFPFRPSPSPFVGGGGGGITTLPALQTFASIVFSVI